ncbi:hypothetical protein [Curtobacterium pusillum]|uniref:hypothetical protein n=1 Tax=Curtobacterium pusillum TaxID=69373 RepID=UPI00119DAA5E|nr:hypothetical protein [Curtobacterium pusillum]
MQTLIDAALPEHDVQLWARAVEPDGSALLRDAERDGNFASMRLLAGGTHVASLALSMRFRWQPHHEALVVAESKYTLVLTGDRQPLARFEYEEVLTSTPRSHWHLHAERGAFSALLSRTGDRGTGRRDSTRLSSLHFPLAGPHFRPSLADVVEFVILECGVDALPGWERALHEYRKDWRRDEAAATARQFSAETAETLRSLGWQVRPPVRGDLPAPFVSVLRK